MNQEKIRMKISELKELPSMVVLKTEMMGFLESLIAAEPLKLEGSAPAKPSRVRLVDDQFMMELQILYPDINVERELNRLKAWLMTPRGQGRKATRQTFVNWLNKCDTPLNVAGTQKTEDVSVSPFAQKRALDELLPYLQERASFAKPQDREKFKAQLSQAKAKIRELNMKIGGLK